MYDQVPFVMRRLLDWMGSLARRRTTFYVIAIGVGVYGVVLRCVGLGKSLWLDEAWVANSVAAPSLSGMFYYDAWLQTSPPLFLVLVRNTVATFGLTNSVLRAIPLLMGLSAALAMFIFAKRVVSRPYALLATALFVLSPVAIEYSKTLKQYSSELAASTTILLVCIAYLDRPTTRRFWLLVATVVIGLLIAYAVAFVLPAIILVVALSPFRPGCTQRWPAHRALWRGVILTTVAAGILIGEYFLFVSPNDPSVLRAHWDFVVPDGPSSLMKSFGKHSLSLAVSESYQLLRELPIPHPSGKRRFAIFLIVASIAGSGFVLACYRFVKGRHKWLELQALCVTPCLLLLIADWFSWYPFTRRTSLFLLPFIVSSFVSSLQLLSYFALARFRWHWLRPLLDVTLLGVTFLTVSEIALGTPFATLKLPREEVDTAVSFLHEHVQSGDVLWVHASCSEAFKLYTRMRGWPNARAKYGHTGWPCCARGVYNYMSNESLVRDDFSGVIPNGFSGRVWLLYTNRASHWRMVGVDERRIMKTVLSEKGCTEIPTSVFLNVGVSSFDCRKRVGRLDAVPPPSESPAIPRNGGAATKH
jgi:hypothetical protein